MEQSTKITYEKVKQDASLIKENANKMRRILEDFNKTMNEVGGEDVFEGQASDALTTSFTALKSKFDAYTSAVERFSNMISSAATATEQTEKSIAAEAENLPK